MIGRAFNSRCASSSPAPRAESLGKFRFWDADFRILSPQPTSHLCISNERSRRGSGPLSLSAVFGISFQKDLLLVECCPRGAMAKRRRRTRTAICARPVSGQETEDAAVPPSAVMNSRRFMPGMGFLSLLLSPCSAPPDDDTSKRTLKAGRLPHAPEPTGGRVRRSLGRPESF